jgi:hypothetical protein
MSAVGGTAAAFSLDWIVCWGKSLAVRAQGGAAGTRLRVFAAPAPAADPASRLRVAGLGFPRVFVRGDGLAGAGGDCAWEGASCSVAGGLLGAARVLQWAPARADVLRLAVCGAEPNAPRRVAWGGGSAGHVQCVRYALGDTWPRWGRVVAVRAPEYASVLCFAPARPRGYSVRLVARLAYGLGDVRLKVSRLRLLV